MTENLNWKNIIGAGVLGLGAYALAAFGNLMGNPKERRLEDIRREVGTHRHHAKHLAMLISAAARVLRRPDLDEVDKRSIGLAVAQYRAAIEMHEEEILALDAEAEGLVKEVEVEKKERDAAYSAKIAARDQTGLDKAHMHIEGLNARITELQAKMSDMVNNSLHRRVHDFMTAFEQPIRTSVGLPFDENGLPNRQRIELRAKLVLEEAIEFASALGCLRAPVREKLENLAQHGIEFSVGELDMVGVADALADVDYVVEGARLTFGIPRKKVADVVHAANMRKVGGPIDPKTGKKLKPEGWVGPEEEIRKILIQHGATQL